MAVKIPVPPTLHVANWRNFLKEYDDNIICEFLEYGWSVGYISNSLPIFNIRTHCGALWFPDQVNAYLQDEIALGQVAGPFSAPPFLYGFLVSPLNTVEKRDSVE